MRETLLLPVQASFAEIVTGDLAWTYSQFTLDTQNLNLQPVSDEILLHSLQSNRQERLADMRG
jgi:hypothetical protein